MPEADLIFLVGPDKRLISMKNSRYESEDLLQTIVELYPEVLTGQTGDSGDKRLALVKREQSVAGEIGGGGRWSLDHLFVDQDGVPTLVEVKRSSDTRIRREVVGQMLDYAANGVKYWPIASLQAQFEKTHDSGPNAKLEWLVGEPTESDAFWKKVQRNLNEGRIRLVFLADEIPDELQRIIEFLNEQMAHTEVLGVEVRQYVGGGRQTLVPRVIGATAQARQAKGIVPKRSFDELLLDAPPDVKAFEKMMRMWAETNGFVLKKKPTALGVETSTGAGLMQLYPDPRWESVEIFLSPLRAQGLEADADWIQSRVSEIVGKPVTAKSPNISCAPLLARWSEFESTVLPRYVESVVKAQRLSATGPGNSLTTN